MKTIMGQDVNTLLTIKDGTENGRIQFFTLICIMLSCLLLYYVAVIIFTKYRISKLTELKNKIYKLKKKENNNLHAPLNEKKMEVKEKLSTPKDSDIEDAEKVLKYFHHNKHL